MTASANLILQKSIHIDQIISEHENDMILSEPENKTKATKKLSHSLNSNKYDEESINTVAVCPAGGDHVFAKQFTLTGICCAFFFFT